MRQSIGGMAAVVLLAVSCSAGLEPKGGMRHYPKKERGGMAFVFKHGGRCVVAGGPKIHVAQPGEKITWMVVNGCDQKVTVDLEVTSSDTANAPSAPFNEGKGPHSREVDVDKIENLTLNVPATVGANGFPDGVESVYKYRIFLHGDPSSGIDPELDIWP